jgi:diguanylate cyclase (GGDEF)-like protein
MRLASITNSLAGRITALVLTSVTVALTVFTLSLVVFDRKSSVQQLHAHLITSADMVGQNSTAALDFRDGEAANQVLQALEREPRIIVGCLYDASGVLFAKYLRSPEVSFCSSTAENLSVLDETKHSVLREVRRKSERLGSIYLVSDMRDVTARERRMILVAAALGCLALLTGGISGSILQRRITTPLRSLQQVMHEVATGDNFDARAEIAGTIEIADLARGFNRMIEELEHRNSMTRQAEASLHSQARTDALTGLPNRRLFTESLSQAVALARRERKAMGLLYIDLDGFKHVNDSLGHSVGDHLLCEVAARLGGRVRQSDMLARVGGDEFTVILRSIKGPSDAGVAADSLLQSLSSPFQLDGREISIGASIGISTFDNSHCDAIDLLKQADSAMYAAKRAGRNRTCHFNSELGNQARERLTLESELRGAIARGEIYVHYQPEYDLDTKRLVRFEALARWRHLALGEIPPIRFIPVAEESGLIHEVGAFVMEEACKEAVRWQTLSPFPVQLAVNVSAIQFNSDSAVADIAAILRRTGLRPELLQIELTESVMMGPVAVSGEKLKRLCELGVTLALDDFGTGYSSLSYLAELPFSSLKIDRSFVKNLSASPEALTLVRSLIGLARNMRMKVIVEGIEEPLQLELLRDLGANEGQGYLLGRPDGNPTARLDRRDQEPRSDSTQLQEAASI